MGVSVGGIYAGVYHLLLVQDICLAWGKRERGSVSAGVRAGFPMAYSLDKSSDTFHGDIFVHRLSFWQKETVIQALRLDDGYRFQWYFSAQDLNLTHLAVRWDAGSYEVSFFYDERRGGQPVRRGHNKDYHNVDSSLYRHDILNETAFSLGAGQYGRVLWNERDLDYDTGEWYYQWHIVNLLYGLDKMPERDIFLARRPDFEYQQMAALY
ncbi:MAG: hypothetical protein NC420_07650 [Eubacterium sp.]|nr:hypothetical protein [Eubacterium sp.]